MPGVAGVAGQPGQPGPIGPPGKNGICCCCCCDQQGPPGPAGQNGKNYELKCTLICLGSESSGGFSSSGPGNSGFCGLGGICHQHNSHHNNSGSDDQSNDDQSTDSESSDSGTSGYITNTVYKIPSNINTIFIAAAGTNPVSVVLPNSHHNDSTIITLRAVCGGVDPTVINSGPEITIQAGINQLINNNSKSFELYSGECVTLQLYCGIWWTLHKTQWDTSVPV